MTKRKILTPPSPHVIRTDPSPQEHFKITTSGNKIFTRRKGDTVGNLKKRHVSWLGPWAYVRTDRSLLGLD